MEKLIKIFAVLGPIILALVGAYVRLKPPEHGRRHIKTWLIAFGIVGVVTAGAAYWNSTIQESLENKRFAYETGGESFCFLKAEITDQTKSFDKIPLRIINEGENPVYDVSIWVSPISNYSAGHRIHRDLILPGAYELVNLSLPLGNYRVEINQRNGFFLEFLRIIEVSGIPRQRIDVYDANGNSVRRRKPSEGLLE